MIGRVSPALVICCVGSCSAGQTPDAHSYDESKLLNPKHTDGRPVMLDFDHHPECFVLGTEGETEVVECPEGAQRTLENCRGSRLYLAKEGTGCVCVPIAEGDTTRVDCEGLPPP